MECVGVLFCLEDTEYLYKKFTDSYGAVCKLPPDDFPLELSSTFSGVSWTNVRKIITFVEKSPEISCSVVFHYIPHT